MSAEPMESGKPLPDRIEIDLESLNPWFPPDVTEQEVQDTIQQALELYFEQGATS